MTSRPWWTPIKPECSWASSTTVTVNNTATYSSEGYIESRIIHSFTLCEYVPDAMDEQSPGTTENPADGARITGIATGPT